jgi:transposase
MSMKPVPWPEPDPQVAAAVRVMYGGKKKPPLAVSVRDRLGEWLGDADFASAFGVRGQPGWSPSRLALVTVLQMAEDLDDRAAAEAVRTRLDWKYALGLGLDDPGFDHSVLSEFRGRVSDHGLEELVLDRLLERLAAEGLVKAGGRQRTDSTHVVAAVAALSRLELAGESVRAALEALAVASPLWLAERVCVPDFTRRYGRPVTSWRPPVSRARRDELAIACARDGYALLEAVYDGAAPGWLRELPAIDVLRRVLLQGYTRTITEDGTEVIRRREKEPEGEGLPPGHLRIASPYDTDARWGVKRDGLWLGYKLHITETCDDAPACTCRDAACGGKTLPAAASDQAPGDQAGHQRGCAHLAHPNLITHVATTDATVTDNQMTAPAHDALAARHLAPGRHYLDSGYLSADAVVQAARSRGIALIGPLLADNSPQARTGGYTQQAFTIDWDRKQATCPEGAVSSTWKPMRTRDGKDAISVRFAAATCRDCPARHKCTTATWTGRQLYLRPHEIHQAAAAARAAEGDISFHADYARRAGVEGTMHQAVAITGSRRARYRGLARTRLEHVCSAAALNLIRLDAYWNDQPLDRRRTSHLARLELDLAT